MRIISVRTVGFNESEMVFHVPAEENAWEFGQVVSLVLLILPFLSFFGKSTLFRPSFIARELI